MRFKIQSEHSDGLMEAPPFEVEIEDGDQLMDAIAEELFGESVLVTAAGVPAWHPHIGYTLTVELICD